MSSFSSCDSSANNNTISFERAVVSDFSRVKGGNAFIHSFKRLEHSILNPLEREILK